MTAPISSPPIRSARRHARRLLDDDRFVIPVAALFALAVCAALISQPSRVGIEITNPTVYDMSVAVTDGEDGGWHILGTVDRGATLSLPGVIDQGETWTFTFAGQARAGGEFSVDRAELIAAGWQIEVPAEVAIRLEDQGALPSPE